MDCLAQNVVAMRNIGLNCTEITLIEHKLKKNMYFCSRNEMDLD